MAVCNFVKRLQVVEGEPLKEQLMRLRAESLKRLQKLAAYRARHGVENESSDGHGSR